MIFYIWLLVGYWRDDFIDDMYWCNRKWRVNFMESNNKSIIKEWLNIVKFVCFVGDFL